MIDFVGGALPNIMFLIGVIAIGIGLGLEFQIIQVKNGLTRGSRIGACVVGVALVVTSIALYLRPTQTASSPAPAVAIGMAATAAPPDQAPTIAPPVAPTASPAAPTPTSVPTVTVPDIREMSPKDAEKALERVGLRLGEPAASCEELGVAGSSAAKARKGRITCQSVEPGGSAPTGSTITYVLSDSKEND